MTRTRGGREGEGAAQEVAQGVRELNALGDVDLRLHELLCIRGHVTERQNGEHWN